jgi:abhydrolase domain-containing protein 13
MDSSPTFWGTALGNAVFVGKLLAAGTALLLITLYFNQDRLLYIPSHTNFSKEPDGNPAGFVSPSEYDLGGELLLNSADEQPIPFEDVFVTTSDDIKIHAWLLLQSNSSEVPTLIYFHGNAANMGYRLPNAAKMFATLGINVLMMDYRGKLHAPAI